MKRCPVRRLLTAVSLFMFACNSIPHTVDVSSVSERGESPTATKRSNDEAMIREVHEIAKRTAQQGPILCSWHAATKDEPPSIRFDLSDGAHLWVFGHGGMVERGGCYSLAGADADRLREIAKSLDITGP